MSTEAKSSTPDSDLDVDPSKEIVQSPKGVQWALIREDYIAQNLRRSKEDPAYTLKDCAESHGVSYVYIRQMASKQGWNKLLKERADALRKEAVTRLQGVALFDELEIRTRQATYARLASSIAHKRLMEIKEADVKKLSIKDAIELMKLGLSEERQALGIGDTVRVPSPGDGSGERVLTDTQVFAVARRVLELRRQEDGSYRAEEDA